MPTLMSVLPPDVLYNCRTNFAEPKWADYDAIEVSPVAQNLEDPDDPKSGTYCEVIFDDTPPDFWSVYAHFREGNSKNGFGADCITDCPGATGREQAVAIGMLFQQLIADATGKHCDLHLGTGAVTHPDGDLMRRAAKRGARAAQLDRHVAALNAAAGKPFDISAAIAELKARDGASREDCFDLLIAIDQELARRAAEAK